MKNKNRISNGYMVRYVKSLSSVAHPPRLPNKPFWMHEVHEICIRRRPLYVRLLFHSNHQQHFFLECSVLPRPAGTVHVTCTRRRDGSVSTVVVYDVGVADGAAVVESRRALGGQVFDGGCCDAPLGNVDWRPGREVASHGSCAALWDSFLRHGSA